MKSIDQNQVSPAAEEEEAYLFPASATQESLWLVDQLNPGGTAYHQPLLFRLRGSLDLEAVEKSFETVCERHEVLKTVLRRVDGKLCQIVLPGLKVPFEVRDLSDLAQDQREVRLKEEIDREAVREIDLAKGPLARAAAWKVAENDFVLMWVFHHVISDGWSMTVFKREMETLYRHHVSGQAADLPELSIQYADYADWQREEEGKGLFERQLSWWKEYLEGELLPAELPTDFARPMDSTWKGAWVTRGVDAGAVEALAEVARRNKATLYMALMSVFKLLLYRYTGRSDLIVGSPVANRRQKELEPLIGYFANLLPVRTDLSGDPSFTELLGRVRENTLNVAEHQDVPFEKLVVELKPERDTSRNPLCQITFALQNATERETRFLGLEYNPVDTAIHASKFDLTLCMSADSVGAGVIAEYRTDLFERETVERLLNHYQNLIREVAAEPEKRLSEFRMLDEAEWNTAVRERNQTKVEYPREASIQELFQQQARERSGAIALLQDGVSMTYGELNARANRMARYLQGQGVRAGDRVAFCMDRSIEMITVILGILKAGAAYVPLDPEYPEDRLHLMVEDAAVDVVLTGTDCGEKLRRTRTRLMEPSEWEAGLTGLAADDLEGSTSGADAAYVIYTSGSTGRSKGVVVPHRGVTRLVMGANYVELGERQTFLHHSSITFDASTFEVWAPLLRGGRCVLHTERLPTIRGLKKSLTEGEVSVVWLTAGLFNLIIDEAPEILEGVSWVLAGGEALSLGHVAKALEKLPEIRLVNGYGPTESTTFAVCCRVPSKMPEHWRSVPIGNVISNTTAYVLDGDGNPVPDGVPGELYLGGDGLAKEYLNSPELTAEKFVPDSFSDDPQARLYRTGDRVRFGKDGRIEYLGRFDFQVKVRGFRIELGEIEAVLNEMEKIKGSVVLVQGDSPSNRRIVAYIVPEEGHGALTSHETLEALRRKLPEHMMPSAVRVLEAFPLNANGKVDRGRLLVARFDSGVAECGTASPENDLEREIEAVWKEVLGVERAGREESFFGLGGHSLAMVQVHERLTKAGHREIKIVDLFHYPTIRSLALYLEEGRKGLESAVSKDELSEKAVVGRNRLAQRRARRV